MTDDSSHRRADYGSTPAPPHLAGCDAEAQEVLRHRFASVLAFLQAHLGVTHEWGEILPHTMKGTLHARFLALEQRLIKSRLGHLESETVEHLRYRREYLAPLTRAVGFYEEVLQEIIGQCHQQGLFDELDPYQQLLTRPSQGDLLPRVLALYDPLLTEQRQADVFLKAGTCRDDQTARAVTHALERTEKRATNRARSLVLAAIKHGWVGLLTYSTYEHTTPLLLLQAHTDLLERLTDTPVTVLGVLRADLIALHRVLQSLEVVWKKKRQPKRYQKLWLEQLLHLPPDHPERENYSQRLTAEIYQVVVQRLAEERSCDNIEATHLFERYYLGGIPLLIDWRCNAPAQTAQQALVQQRLAQTVKQQLAALQPHHHQHIIRLIEALSAACHTTNVHLPIVRLLNDPPSSYYRQRLGRRFSFGFGRLVRQRMRRYRRRRVILGRRRRPIHADAIAQDGERPEDRLVAEFTRKAGLSAEDDYREGRTLLRQFITYGGIGLLSKGQWWDLLDDRVVRVLAFYKLGFPAGTTNWPAVLARTQEYAASLDLVPPSSQVAKAVFNSINKPVRWHGGDGPTVRQVRQRQTLMLQAPRLHETWMVLPGKQRLNLHIVDEAQRLLSDTCHALLVFDTAIERPVGFWLNITQPRSPEVGLLLYQAIWHPGALTWPLRGVPQCIEIPEMLVADGTQYLERAARSLLSKIEVITRRKMDYTLSKMPYAAKLMKNLANHAPDYIRRKTGQNSVTLQQAMDALRTWLHIDKIARIDPHQPAYPRADCFPHHNAPDVPASVAQYGVALPGHHFQAAGWLLPVAEHQATTIRDAIVFRGLIYGDIGFQSEPGHTLNVRLFPYWYRNMQQSLFVEVAPDKLHYLVRKD
jgi:hypothetical protein